MPTSPGSCRTTPRDARARPSGGTRPGVSLAVCVSLSWACGAAGATFRFGEIGITVPDGFSVERVAAPPLVERPVSLAFDEDGRLYVADSSGSSDKLVEQQSDPRHRIFRLVDRDGDGVFDTRTLFADRLMMLQGTLWHRGSLYAASGPQIWRFTDTDGDGVADERSVWFDGKTLTGCGNDMHGPYRGPDGWFYWCKGAFAEQTHDLPGRPGWKTRAAHIFRCPPDRPVREIEPVMTGGMDNPVDVAFSATGERFLSATFLEHPAGGRRDGVIHALYGGVYGKDHGVLDGHARTGDLLPALVQLGPAAACGLHVHSGHGLGDDYAGNLFACSFNLRTVSRHVPVPRGGTFDARDEPFLSADVADFHPTDVIEDADGSLLVVDTGGWYKLCCPTSQIGKPTVLGGIYRVRRAAGPSSDDPRGRRIDWHALDAAGLTALLDDARPAVVERALDLAAQRGAAAVESLARAAAGGGTSRSRRHAVWALARIDHPAARSAAVTALADPAPDVRQAAAHAVGLWRDPAGLARLVRLLDDADAGIVRAAAEALGRLGNAAVVPAVLAACSRADDRALEHSLTYALIEVGRTEPLSAALAATDPRIRRAVLVALDQMQPQAGPAVPLERHVIAACRDDDPRVRDAALWIASRHPEWAGPLAAEVGPQADWAADHPDEAPRITLRLARLAAHPALADALAAAYRDGGPATRAVACAVMRAARLKHAPESWVDALAGTLARDADDSLETLAALPLAPEQRQRLRPVVVPLAAGADTAPKRRLLAVQVAGPDGGLPDAVADRLVDMAASAGPDDGGSPLDRSAAVAALVAARPSAAALARLAPALVRLPANDVAALLPVCARAGGQPLDAALVAVAGHPDPAALDRAVVATFVDALPEDRRARGRALLARIDAARSGQREAFERLAASLPDGDAARGHLVFASSKAACTTCHAMAHVGGRIGPDLSKIGRIRQPRDLLEAIVLPSASFVRSYEPMAVLTEDGRAFQGIVSDDGATELVLQTSATASERIPRSAIESIEPGTVSLMPKGYDTILSAQELADLVAFLARAK